MINCIKDTELYRDLNLHRNLSHAYLFYSTDSELNNQIALTFAKSLLCNNICTACPACKQFDSHSHPDVIILDQDSIKVDDVNKLTSQLNTLPVSSQYKIFVILSAEKINEIAQNKLLKSLEEPNKTNIFILTCSKTDKLLPTILSRLTKIFIPKLSILDKSMISRELQSKNINIGKYLDSDFTITQMIDMETNEKFLDTISAIKEMFTYLKTSADIPKVSSSIVKVDKTLFFPLLQDIFLDCINKTKKYDPELTTLISMNYPELALVNSLPYIEESYKKIMSNVNFSYILDNLLFNILKEKFLCKH